MNRPSRQDETARRIGLFCSGVAVIAFFALVAYGAFAVETIPSDPTADEREYWSDLSVWLQGHPKFTLTMFVSVAMAALGVGMMVWSLIRRKL